MKNDSRLTSAHEENLIDQPPLKEANIFVSVSRSQSISIHFAIHFFLLLLKKDDENVCRTLIFFSLRSQSMNHVLHALKRAFHTIIFNNACLATIHNYNSNVLQIRIIKNRTIHHFLFLIYGKIYVLHLVRMSE